MPYAELMSLSSFLHKGHLTGLLRQWRTRSTQPTNRERNMNTITINSTPEGATITYTEAEVLHFIAKAGEVSGLNDSITAQLKEIRNIRNEVRDFFSEGEWQDGETTVNKGDVNVLLDSIGAAKLTTKYNGTFTVTGTFNIEVEEEDEIESIIADNMEVSVWGADIDVDSIEVIDVEVDN